MCNPVRYLTRGFPTNPPLSKGEIGNGRATAILLARHGAQVALVDMDRAWATETKRMIDDEREEEEEEGYDDGSSSSSSSSASHGGGAPSSRPSSSRCEVIQADVTDEDACRAVVERTVARFGAVHILVNNVGVGGAMGDATTVDVGPGPGGWDRGWRVNVTSMVLMCRYAVPEMRRAGRGAVVNMSSVSGSEFCSGTRELARFFLLFPWHSLVAVAHRSHTM